MLVTAQADATPVISRGLLICASVCCAFVVVSLGLFALSQASGASNHQVAEVKTPGLVVATGQLTATTQSGGPSPGAATAAPPTRHQEGQPRRMIDQVAGTLTSPFRSFIHSDSQWAVRIASTLLALLVYGLGLGYLARWAKT